MSYDPPLVMTSASKQIKIVYPHNTFSIKHTATHVTTRCTTYFEFHGPNSNTILVDGQHHHSVMSTILKFLIFKILIKLIHENLFIKIPNSCHLQFKGMKPFTSIKLFNPITTSRYRPRGCTPSSSNEYTAQILFFLYSSTNKIGTPGNIPASTLLAPRIPFSHLHFASTTHSVNKNCAKMTKK